MFIAAEGTADLGVYRPLRPWQQVISLQNTRRADSEPGGASGMPEPGQDAVGGPPAEPGRQPGTSEVGAQNKQAFILG